ELPAKIGKKLEEGKKKASDGMHSVMDSVNDKLKGGLDATVDGMKWIGEKTGGFNMGNMGVWNIPGYEKGTEGHPGGLAVVGEKGRELAHVPGQGLSMVGSKGAQLLNLPKGTSVLPNRETESLIK